jgi:hypothetical protein
VGGDGGMTQPQQPRQVSLNDVLLIVGQQAVEIAFLRARVAEIEQQANSPNGQARLEEEGQSAAQTASV